MSEFVRISDEGHVRHLILDRPEKRNAVNHQMVLELREAARDASEDHDVWCVVLRGEGAAFSAGIIGMARGIGHRDQYRARQRLHPYADHPA